MALGLSWDWSAQFGAITGVRHSAGVRLYGGTASGDTSHDATFVVRLLGKDKQIIWVREVRPGFMARSASSSVAEEVLKELAQGS